MRKGSILGLAIARSDSSPIDRAASKAEGNKFSGKFSMSKLLGKMTIQ